MKRLIVATVAIGALAASAQAAAPKKAHAGGGGAPAAKGWSYTDKTADTGARLREACTLSENFAKLSFPYKPARVRFCVTYVGDGKDLGVKATMELVGKGQFTGDVITLQFDGGNARVVHVGTGNEYLVMEEGVEVVRSVRRSKTMVANVSFFDDGSQDLRFNVEGLTYPRPGLTTNEFMRRSMEIRRAEDDKAKIDAINAEYDCIAEERTDCPK
jgi:hypothetical protein